MVDLLWLGRERRQLWQCVLSGEGSLGPRGLRSISHFRILKLLSSPSQPPRIIDPSNVAAGKSRLARLSGRKGALAASQRSGVSLENSSQLAARSGRQPRQGTFQWKQLKSAVDPTNVTTWDTPPDLTTLGHLFLSSSSWLFIVESAFNPRALRCRSPHNVPRLMV